MGTGLFTPARLPILYPCLFPLKVPSPVAFFFSPVDFCSLAPDYTAVFVPLFFPFRWFFLPGIPLTRSLVYPRMIFVPCQLCQDSDPLFPLRPRFFCPSFFPPFADTRDLYVTGVPRMRRPQMDSPCSPPLLPLLPYSRTSLADSIF